jgi:hypothetical protein
MTGVQLGLLAASLIVHREPWVLSAPQEPQTQSQSECPAENCVYFSPEPPEQRTGRILKVAAVVNLPAVFGGDFLRLAAVLIHIPYLHGEPALLGFSALFVPALWYRIGRWMDDLAMGVVVGESTRLSAKAVWRVVARAIVWFLFVMTLLSFLMEGHRESNETKFMLGILILWTGAYLAGGFLGDRLRKARLRALVG